MERNYFKNRWVKVIEKREITPVIAEVSHGGVLKRMNYAYFGYRSSWYRSSELVYIH